MAEKLDENDPFYAFKKWGPDYRTKDAYWIWRHAHDDKQRAEAAQGRGQREPLRSESSPYFVK